MPKDFAPSFSYEAKEECARFERNPMEERAFLSSFVRMNGLYRLGQAGGGLSLSSQQNATMKAVYQYLVSLYGVSCRFSYTREPGFLKRIVYHVILDQGADIVLKDLEVDFLAPTLPKDVIATAEGKASFLAGAFLAGGSVNAPSGKGYHLEISLHEQEFAKFLLKTLQKYPGHPFSAKLATRRGKLVVYLKKGDEISDFLILIGAKEACLRFEDARVDREFAGIGNRLANLDSANYRRSSASGAKQADAIRRLVERYGWDYFEDPRKKLLAELRLQEPDLSLAELADRLSTALNASVSRSWVNHFFRSIEEK